MSEYELADLAGNYSVGAMTSMSLYLTIVTAYLVTAFVAGKRLQPIEVFIVTVLFVLSASFFIFGTVGFFTRQVYVVQKLAAIQTDATFFMSSSTPMLYIVVVELLGILASLIFMWSVRRRDSE